MSFGIEKLPVHVAIIMDGNGRWAVQKNLPRTEGHRAGAARVREIAEVCLELGIKYLTVFAFSKENWQRPRAEVRGIMRLTEYFFQREFKPLKKKGVFFVHLGDRTALPKFVLKILDSMKKNEAPERKMYLSIAFNYSGRAELTAACRRLMERTLSGEIRPEEVTEKDIDRLLYTHELPDPDLLIRTGGEMRVSNFLLWQIAYSEIWVTDVLWPDFSREHFIRAIREYGLRDRRFGGALS